MAADANHSVWVLHITLEARHSRCAHVGEILGSPTYMNSMGAGPGLQEFAILRERVCY